ncbi:MAG: hypothetical protein MUO54_03805, partial [Anaerolineales bacterium]|nr:hypothetical protein [Anaerolineales bacterium]
IQTHPILRVWNQQNITNSPQILDLLISFAPCLFLAVIGVKKAWIDQTGKHLVIWAATGIVLIYMPWNLQRRFLTGIYVPLAGLSVFGLQSLRESYNKKGRWTIILLAGLILPTNAIVIFSGIQAAFLQDPKVYISRDVIQGLDWIQKNTDENALILTDEKTGLFIPSFTGRRVIFGHPFETIHAGDELFLVEAFFDGSPEPGYYSQIITERQVDFVFLNQPASKNLSEWINEEDSLPVFNYQDIKIYAVGQ